jgi:hypothetical protein
MGNPDAPVVAPNTAVEAPTTPAEKLMAQRPFAPTDRGLFAYKLYPANTGHRCRKCSLLPPSS